MSEGQNRPLRVFLCHASDDKEAIRALYRALSYQGINVWFDEEKLLPGQHWQREIPEALYKSDVIIVCLSKSAITKEGYIQREIGYALDAAKEKPDGTIFLIPVKIEECDVPKQLSHLQWSNLFYKFGVFENRDYEKLISSLDARAVSVNAELPKRIPIRHNLDPEYDIFHPTPMLIVISGPTGSENKAVVARLKDIIPQFHFVITVTTRPKRSDETHGKDYFFFSKDEFATMIDKGEFLEYANVYGNYVGVPKSQVRDALRQGKDVIIRLDVQGAETIRKLVPEAVLIFITPSNAEDLVDHLKAKLAEEQDLLSLRVATARRELKRVEAFDFIIVNYDGYLDQTVHAVMAIIDVEHHRVRPRAIEL